MENVAPISGPQVPIKINKFNFSSVYSGFIERNYISPIET